MREYLDYQNCESTKKLIDNLVEEDDEDINSFLFYWLKKNNISVQYISSATNQVKMLPYDQIKVSEGIDINK